MGQFTSKSANNQLYDQIDNFIDLLFIDGEGLIYPYNRWAINTAEAIRDADDLEEIDNIIDELYEDSPGAYKLIDFAEQKREQIKAQPALTFTLVEEADHATV